MLPRYSRTTGSSSSGRSNQRSSSSSVKRPINGFPQTLVAGIVLISFATTASVVATLQIVFHQPTIPASTTEALIAPPLKREDVIEGLKLKYKPSIWTTRKLFDDKTVEKVRSFLSDEERNRAMELCSNFLFSSILKGAVTMMSDHTTFVSTGDISDMWIRDSTVQIGIYFQRQGLRQVVEGTIRQQAFYILQDPYANAFSKEWNPPSSLEKKLRVIGRGGWVGTRNYELDSGAYFLNQVYDYYVLYPSSSSLLLQETNILQAVELTVDTWIVEQHHEEKSPYRYLEVERNGMGPESAYTGMTWTGFRPSDDPCKYGYLIPANIHAAAGLERIIAVNEQIWKSSVLEKKVTKLLRNIEDGIRKHGIIKTDSGEEIYAYEVDGKGNHLSDFDDANVPSLLSLPLLGWSGLDISVYEQTRTRILSKANPYYFEGKVHTGIGSPHTPQRMVWPMAFAMDGLTTKSAENVANQIKQSLAAACNDAMHESVDVEVGCQGRLTRHWFEWANALFVVLVETALGESCEAEAQHKVRIANANPDDVVFNFFQNKYNSDPNEPLMYQGIEAYILFGNEKGAQPPPPPGSPKSLLKRNLGVRSPRMRGS